MISVNEAIQRIDRAMPPRPDQVLAIAETSGKILAQDVRAERDQPPFDRVMMDGIAIDHSAFKSGLRRFRLAGIQAAGAPRKTLRDPSDCIEIMTGAVLPAQSDCIVPIEQIRLTGDHAELDLDTSAEKWQFVHRAGSDYGGGDVLLQSGTMIGGPEMAVLASAGAATVAVAKMPAIKILAVGDELTGPGKKLGPSQIRRSNDFAIDTLLRQTGLTDNARDQLPDDPKTLRLAIDSALHSHDIVVLTGGVSMGKYDYIPSIMNDLGVTIVLHKVAQKPGKPMWAGSRDDRMVFALPGNPVSSLVCARRFVIPAVQRAMGYQAPAEIARLGTPLENKASLTWFVPVTLSRHEFGMAAEARLPNTSGDFHTLAGTTGFIELPAGPTALPAGFLAPLWRW